MKIERFVIGPIGTNCYIVINEETKESFVTDPAACPPELVSHIRSTGLKVQAVLLQCTGWDILTQEQSI